MLTIDDRRNTVCRSIAPQTSTKPMGAHRIQRVLRALGRELLLLIVICICAGLLATPGSTKLRDDIQRNKLRLDHELRHAREQLGLPDGLLAPVVSTEQEIAFASTWNANDQVAAADYSQLYTQLMGIEQTSTATVQEKTQGDLGFFTDALDQRRNDGFSEINGYQARLDTALETLSTAKTTADYAHVDAFIQAQTDALHTLWPAYLQLQSFRATLRSLRLMGMPSELGEQFYQRDVLALREASPPERYTRLVAIIDGQMMQVEANQASALAINAPALLKALQARGGMLRQQGETATAAMVQHAYNEDVRILAPTSTPGDYLALARTIDDQAQALALPLLRAGTRRDLQALAQLIASAQMKGTLDPYNGRRYPAAYEYADAKSGYGALQQRLTTARDIAAVQAVADDAAIMATNLHALLDNLNDSTSHSRPHRTDLRLLRQYNLLQGRVIVVSLREQTARIYENGQMVRWSYVTTGRIELPSPPGIHYAMNKGSPVLFISPEPRSSPFWFAPTPVTYAIQYADGGDFLHDASWRSGFGPGTNLPHYDPIAFNGGSHGCINFPEETMRWLYDWTPIGTPVIVY